ncbi:MAG: hypothetical protein JXN59_01970 [Anaerolineae bacterium]|nr:hypothetical protein [Anaerolineae bacterium]
MSDLRTMQMLAYMTHQPARYREVLGLPARGWRRQEGERPRQLWRFGGRLLTRAGQWMLARAAQQTEDAPVASHTKQTA